MPFDLQLLESFVAVAETHSFSEAAKRTHTVQSAISAHIKRLEQEVNRSLVERGRGQPVTITPEGTAFLVQARRMLLLADEMRRPQGTVDGAQPLRIGTTVTFALSVLPRALATFSAHTRPQAVRVKTARSHELLELLEDDHIDIALLFDQGARSLRHSTVYTQLVWLAVEIFRPPPDDPLPIAFLDDARDLRRHAFASLDKMGTIATALTTHPDPIGLRAFVAAGLAMTVLPRPALTPPFIDVGYKFGLPELKVLQVSVYRSKKHTDERVDAMAKILASELKRP